MGGPWSLVLWSPAISNSGFRVEHGYDTVAPLVVCGGLPRDFRSGMQGLKCLPCKTSRCLLASIPDQQQPVGLGQVASTIMVLCATRSAAHTRRVHLTAANPSRLRPTIPLRTCHSSPIGVPPLFGPNCHKRATSPCSSPARKPMNGSKHSERTDLNSSAMGPRQRFSPDANA